MASIEEYLEAIQSAVYGEEVRGSIHDALSAVNAEAEKSTGIAKVYRDSARSYAEEAESTKNDVENLKSQTNQIKNDTTELYEQARDIVVNLPSGLIPMGGITIETLPSNPRVGWMYYLTEDGISTSDFIEGAGIELLAGIKIYFCGQNKWSIMIDEDVNKKILTTFYQIDNSSTRINGNEITMENSMGVSRTTLQEGIESDQVTTVLIPFWGKYIYTRITTITSINGIYNIDTTYTQTEKEEN